MTDASATAGLASALASYAAVPRGGALWLEGSALALAVLHALAAVALLGASTHDAVLLVGYLRGRFGRVALEKLYVQIEAAAYVVTLVLGAVIYPSFRIYVRATVFDRHAVWAANLFDLKESLAALGLPAVLGLLVLSRVIDPRRDGAWLPLYVGLGLGVTAIVWFAVVSGLVVTHVRGLG